MTSSSLQFVSLLSDHMHVIGLHVFREGTSVLSRQIKQNDCIFCFQARPQVGEYFAKLLAGCEEPLMHKRATKSQIISV